MARSNVLIAILLTIANLPGLVSCWNLSITSKLVEDLNNPSYIDINCQATDMTNCQFRIYNYKTPPLGNKSIDCSQANWARFNWEDGKAGDCRTSFGNKCEIRLYTAGVTSGRHVVGCRAKNSRAGGGWKYNYTTIYHDNTTVHLAPLGEHKIVELGEDTEFLCPHSGKEKLSRCIFSLPNTPANDNVNLSQGPRSKLNETRYSYAGAGLQFKKTYECGIRILNITEEDNGIVWCRLKLTENNDIAVRAFALIVAKPPSKATFELIRDDNSNNTVHATCSVSASRPVATIKWLYNGGRVIREDRENDTLTDEWFWPWDEQPITQVQRQILRYESDQMSCVVTHQETIIPTESTSDARYVLLDSWQMIFTQNDPIQPSGTSSLLCNASVALTECGFQISDDSYYDVSQTIQPVTSDGFFTLQNENTQLELGVCGLKFTAQAIGNSYRIGCRGRVADGGWKYAYTNLDVLDDLTCQLTNFASNSTVSPGDDVTLGCVEKNKSELKECTVLTATDKELAKFYLSRNSTPRNVSRHASHRYSYPFDEDEIKHVCGVQIHGVTETDNGIIKLRALTPDGKNPTRTIYFPVTKPPQKVRLYGVQTSQYKLGDTLEAFCAVSECRPPATITWYLDDDVIDNNTSDVTVEELLDHEWRWMIDARNVTQRFRKKIAESDKGKTLSCVVNHEALKENKTTQFKKIKVLIPSTASSPPSTKRHGPGLTAPPKTIKDAGMPTGIVIGLAVAILIVVSIMVATMVYSKIKRIWCFAEQQSAMPSKHERAANEMAMDDGVPLYAVVNMDNKNKNKSRPGAAGHSGAATEDGAAIYAVVNKDTKNNKKAIPGRSNQKGEVIYAEVNKDTKNNKKAIPGTSNQKGEVIYSEVNKDTKNNKKAIPGTSNQKGEVIYAEVNKDTKNSKKAIPGTSNQKGEVIYAEVHKDTKKNQKATPRAAKEDESVLYSVVNKEPKNKKKTTPGTSPAADSVIYAEIVNKNAGKPARKSKAALPQDNVEYADIGWNH